MNDEHFEHGSGPEPTPADMAAGHETSDASIPGLVVFLAALIISLAVVVFAIAWMFDFLAGQAERRDRPQPALAKLRPGRPPGPQLQQSPAFDMQELRGRQVQKLDHVEWIDKQEGIIRLKIDQAMKLITHSAQREKTNGGLPRTEQTEKGLPKWPRVEVEKISEEEVAQKKASKPPGTGKNPEAKSRNSVSEKQPSDVPPTKADAGKSEGQK